MRKNRIQAQHRTRPGYADDHLFILKAPGGELQIAAADQVKAARILALGEERGLSRQRDGAGGKFKIRQYGAAQRAEPAGAAIGAGRTPHRNLPCDVFLPSLYCCRDLCVCHGLAPSAAGSISPARLLNRTLPAASGPIPR